MTLFETIYDEFLSNITDYDIVQYDEGVRLALLRQLLGKSVYDFKEVCQHDLEGIDEEEQAFTETLTDSEIKVLSIGMNYYWVSQKILNSDNLKPFLSTKDFYLASPANMLRALKELRDSLKDDFNQAIIKYSYDNGSIESLTP